MASYLDAASSQYFVASSTSIGAMGTGDFTFSLWVRPASASLSGTKWMLMKRQGAGLAGWHIDVASGKLRALVVDAASAYVLTESASLSADTWYHAMVVFDRSGTGSLIHYMDGSQVASAAFGSLGAPDNAEPIGIGRAADYDGLYYTGAIAEVGMWSTALTANHAASLAAGYSPATIRPDSLLTYWKFVNGATTTDSWGQNNLTAYNTPTTITHPPIIYRSRPRTIITIPAPVAKFSIFDSPVIQAA